MKRFYVYELVRKSNGKVIYVGKGSGRRMDLHRLFAQGWNTRKQRKLYAQLSAVLQSGDDFFARKVFESDDEGEVLDKELETINRYGLDNLFNGVSSHIFGAINSEKAAQVRQAISRARLGMKFSDEHRANIRKALLNRPPRTPEHRLHQSLAQTGRPHPKVYPATTPEQRIAKRIPALNAEERRERYLAKHARMYQKRRVSELARLKSERDTAKERRWGDLLASKGLPPDTPPPVIFGPLAHLTKDQRIERKRARERINHVLRQARVSGDVAQIERLEIERRKLDEAQEIVSALLDY